MKPSLKIWIDRGGTFTDVIAQRSDGSLATLKLLSADPERYADPVREGINRVLGAEGDRANLGLANLVRANLGEVNLGLANLGEVDATSFDSGAIEVVRIGTTIATNALLESKGEPTVLVTTRGFGDALWIGYQARPKIFDLNIRRPAPLYERVIQVNERLAEDGSVSVPLAETKLEDDLRAARESGLKSAAIVFMHSYRNPVHEQRAASLARRVGFEYVAVSSEVSPLIRFVSRGQTTVADAYLTPLIRRYFQGLNEDVQAPLFFMQSNGGLVIGDRVLGKDVVYSGPAGGVVGMAKAGEREGFTRLIGFDMGGTSTDVSVYDGAFERRDETIVRGLRLRAPSLEVNSVASGGGSILSFDGMRLRVGDDSAGADPGPAAYGRGGPLTITDCHVLLGRLQPSLFPNVFGSDGHGRLELGAVRRGFTVLSAEVAGATGVRHSPEELAIDFLEIAVRKMAQAVRRLTVGRGLDPSNFVLVAFGGAAGQHACSVANELGIDTILVPPAAGLLSAIGIGMADIRKVKQRAFGRPCTPANINDLIPDADALAAEVSQSIIDQGVSPDRVSTNQFLHVHYEGVESKIRVALGEASPITEAFRAAHRKRFGFDMPRRRIIIASIEVEGVGAVETRSTPAGEKTSSAEAGTDPGIGLGEHDVWFSGGWMQTPFLDRSPLSNHPVSGPAVIIDPDTTTIVEDGWSAELTGHGAIKMTRLSEPGQTSDRGRIWNVDMDPMRLEIFENLFMHIAEQMGDQLRRTARSVNVKERLDYSCALFDRTGELIANAPHIPVHLGAMSETVRQVMADFDGRMMPGDAFLANNPFRGGTHVPDLTVVSPVFIQATAGVPSIASAAGPVAFVASRAHHADIGGKSPGSMPADAVGPEEEGVVFDGLQIVSEGIFHEEQIRRILAGGPHPARDPDSNIGDIQAQLAANQTGIIEFGRAESRYGMDVVEAYMGHVRTNAAETIRKILATLNDGAFSVEMDSGQRIAVAIRVDRGARSATIDFTGTSDQAANSLNAPRAITTAAVLYVLRCLAGSDLPLNSGCLEPVDIIVPRGSMLDPVPWAAVAGGNVETSQCIVDALLGALKIQAGSQGTMNNVTFGNAEAQYYETVCGGTGAGPDFDGASAVHSHMTNSRITDPEIVEVRMPVVVEEFSIRRESGGRGRHPGGDGAVRRIRFTKGMTLSILSNRRKVPAHGLEGGGPGRPGRNVLIRAGGSEQDLGSTAQVLVEPGDVLVIETPGGGGYGSEV